MFQTKTDTFHRQVPVALAAIGQHMHEHQLPTPLTIVFHPDQQSIRVQLTGAGLTAPRAWLDTLLLDEESNEDVPGFADKVRTTWAVRLPDLGVRLELVAYRPRPLLTAVSA